MTMLDIIKDLHPIRSGVVCSGAEAVNRRLLQELPFTIHEFESGEEHNGWIVPHAWECTKATIHNQAGDLIYDGNAHPLGVCAYSEPCIEGMGGAALKEHLYFDPRFPDGLIYHCDWWYKPHIKDWGLVVPKTLYDCIGDRDAFHVELRATKTPGKMQCLEYIHEGWTNESIAINANQCHPGCSNDDLSGCAVGIEVFKRLKGRETRYTYRLLLAPEHYGSIFWIKRFAEVPVNQALFLESVGSSGPLVIQASFDEASAICSALYEALPFGSDERRAWDLKNIKPFRSVVGNDETCWEAAGIPCPSLSRCPFDEYHSDRDNPSIMREDSLEQAVQVVLGTIDVMEKNCRPTKRFHGLMCLSNPKYDLYKPMFDPSIPDRRCISDEARRWNSMMDGLPQLLDGSHSVLDIADRYGLRFHDVHAYLDQWKAKGLIE